jgi:hypothetical protein
MLGRLFAAVGGAFGFLAFTSKATPAQAGLRTTLFADGAQSYGAAVTYPSNTDPTGFLPSLAGVTVGLISSSVNTAMAPQTDAMVVGTANTLTGVQGLSRSNIGVLGKSESGRGVLGQSNSSPGVQGESQTSYGVSGICFGASVGVFGGAVNGAGVWGQSNNYVGVVGNSLGNATGVFGVSQGGGTGVLGDSVGGIGVYAIARVPFLPALYAQSVAGSGQVAGRFDGSVVVYGNHTVTGVKSAVVPHSDGSLRTMYCQESPEAWFEDFGRGQLTNGVARIRIDPDFAALVHQQEYHVFTQPEATCNGLFVVHKTPGGFEVHELNGGKSSLPFAYRIVARRKDVSAPRLARVDAKLHGRHAAMDLIPGAGLGRLANRPGENPPTPGLSVGPARNGPPGPESPTGRRQ